LIYLRALLGVVFFCAVGVLLSSDRRRFQVRAVAGGILLQLAIAALILKTDAGEAFFASVASGVSKLTSMAEPGARAVFGSLADPGAPAGFVFAFAGTGLVVIIFVSALMSVLYHIGVMQLVVWVLARVMSATMGLSGGESMAAAANIFMGQTEAPLVIRPYLAGMTRSELNALMTGGFATIAGSVMAIYMGLLGPEYAPHLVTASVMSAPASFVLAKLIVPEDRVPETAGRVELRIERTAGNLIEAAASGTSDGLKLWLNVIAMLIAFIALVTLINWPLGAIGHWLGLERTLSLQSLFGVVFAPVAWLMGVESWHDCRLLGGLLGTQISVNEFVAFTELKALRPGIAGADPFESLRAAKMAAYALCGFANFSSIGIQLGGISALVPERRTELSQLALRAMIGGACACWMTATIAGVFL
jgi:CNT family concentrative nucleoside transporter